MVLEHVALWTYKLDELKDFYVKYFDGKAGKKYNNVAKKFSSYFLEFESGARLELMQMPKIPAHSYDIRKQFTGLIHIAFGLNSQEEVTKLTERLQRDGFEVIEPLRVTGDGYFESVILDPDENRVELTYKL
ncbi:VOC family protein [Roseivirga misakiensis]|uniref:Glyoxalase n=1 Tax=Roseivirga misakiensis TaxID=1563681 RepID=A0A1E5SLG5_9BACT|nr:VOC family protein [Roseivirga misakiensis]OEJ99933.1 glyoxalase [Roseivirga misakiensis]